MSRLSGSQLKQVQDALLSAYGSQGELDRMVRFELDQNLAQIAGGDNLTAVVFDLITWAESRGFVGDLIDGALRGNSTNADLQALAATGLGGSGAAASQGSQNPVPAATQAARITDNMVVPATTEDAVEGGYSYDIFISYSHKDESWVWNTLLPRLEQAGLRVCVDDRDFEIGVPSVVNMERAVESSRRTLLVLTPNWVASEWTAFESLLIQTNDPSGRLRRMIPLMREQCQPPARIAILTYADFTAENETALPWDRLIRSLQR